MRIIPRRGKVFTAANIAVAFSSIKFLVIGTPREPAENNNAGIEVFPFPRDQENHHRAWPFNRGPRRYAKTWHSAVEVKLRIALKSNYFRKKNNIFV